MIDFNENDTNAEMPGKMRVGTKIIRQLSTSFYPDLKMVFGELVANARDAMATGVKIKIDDDKIIFEDNGEGMTQEELVKFFYISHSQKEDAIKKTRGTIQRDLIGKFGIGKLTLYRLCRSFEIVSWRDGKSSRAVFDFEQFEKKDFVDEFDLKIEPVKNQVVFDSGTRITMFGLKEQIAGRDVKRYLQNTMPLTPDFRVTISSPDLAHEVEIKVEDLWAGKGKLHEISGDKETGVGPVKGRMVILDHGIKESGVYIKVFGRLVNYGKPDDIIDYNDLTHAFSFPRKIIVEVNADGLNDVLLTNRSGFVQESKKFQDFRTWLRRVMQDTINYEYERRDERGGKFEAESIPRITANLIRSSFSTEKSIKSTKAKIESSGSKHIISKEAPKKNRLDEIMEENESDLVIEGIKVKIAMEPLGKNQPEAKFDKVKNQITINTTHPLYEYARSNGKIWGALYHTVRASIVLISMELAKNLDDFKKLYNKLSEKTSEMLQEVDSRAIRKEVG